MFLNFSAYLYEVTNDVNMPFYVGSSMQILAVSTYIITVFVRRGRQVDLSQGQDYLDDIEVKGSLAGSQGHLSHLGSMKGSISYLGSISYIGSVRGSTNHIGGSMSRFGSIRGSALHVGFSAKGSVSHLGSARSIHTQKSTSHRIISGSILLPTPAFGSMVSINYQG